MRNPASEEFVREVVAVLETERRRRELSHERLAALAGVHRSTVSRTMRGLMSPTLFVVHALATALELRLEEVMHEAERNRPM